MNRIFKWLVWLIILTPLVYLASVWSLLPATVPTHFNLEGKADNYGSKNELIVMAGVFTLISSLVYLLLVNAYRIDPKKHAAENRSSLERIAAAIAVFTSGLLILIIYSVRQGNFKLDSKYIFAGVGILLSIIGNYMYHIKPNYFAGLRLPWTLENEENWRKTHLLAGKLWFFGGILAAILSFILPSAAALVVFFVIIFGMTLAPAIYSYRLYKSMKSK
jgi:uncharacterized membrane protein